MTSGPPVSIGMPVYNGETFLRDALDSLLEQTYDNLEVVICDNASTDSTGAICQEYAARDPRVKYFRSPTNIGCLPNIRRSLTMCTGKYITWTCHDDMRPPTAIQDAVEALERNPAAVFAHAPVLVDIYPRAQQVEVPNTMDLSGPRASDRIREFTWGLQHNGMIFGLYRREALVKMVLGMHSGHDYLFCMQACLIGPGEYLSSPQIIYRQKGGVDSPMHSVEPITLRDLLVYRGVRRTKCWLTFFMGCYYLARLPGVRPAERLGGISAHVRHFTQRFRGQLVSEIPFILCTPLLWLFTPFVPTGRKLKTALKARRAHSH